MANKPDKQADKWRQFRWIPVLFVCSLVISVIALSLNSGSHVTFPSNGASQSNDPLQPLATTIPDEVKSNLLYGLIIALIVTGGACAVYVLINKGSNNKLQS